MNQLIREDNAWLGKTIAYTYDKGGNIQLVEEYTLTSGALDGLTATNSYSYLYGDSNWKDKLTSYNGNTITYDQIGNPISYYNGISFVWEDGRQLAGIETASGDGIFYLYNSDGIRTFKMVGTTVTNYTLEGDKVVHETNGTDEFWYYYDESGNLVSFELNGTSYYYVKNLQGDIIAITDDSGNKVVEYVYNSWGKLISTTGTLAETVGVKNPYRYRGYRYDTETCLYYLQSRYYDPEIRRFINADSYVDTGDTVLSTNMFAYCENSPIICFDFDGMAKSYIKSTPSNMHITAEVSAAIKEKGVYKKSTFMKKVSCEYNITKYYYLISKKKGFFGDTHYTVVIYSVKTMTHLKWISYLTQTYKVYFNYLKNNDYISEFFSVFCEATGYNKVNLFFNLINEAIKLKLIGPKEVLLYYKAAKKSKYSTVTLVKSYSVVGYTINKRGKTKNYTYVGGKTYY